MCVCTFFAFFVCGMCVCYLGPLAIVGEVHEVEGSIWGEIRELPDAVRVLFLQNREPVTSQLTNQLTKQLT